MLKTKLAKKQAGHKVIIKIDAKGGVEVSVKGQCGPSCKDLTAGLESDLGETTDDAQTPEFLKAAPVDNNLTHLG